MWYLTRVLLQLHNQEVEWLFGAGDNQLLEQVLEDLEYFKALEFVLDFGLVVKLLYFIHFTTVMF
jgi:hypothetical protein